MICLRKSKFLVEGIWLWFTAEELLERSHLVLAATLFKNRITVAAPFFLDGCLDACLRPIEEFGHPEGGIADSHKTVEQHMIERLSMSYAKEGKDPRHNEDTFSV